MVRAVQAEAPGRADRRGGIDRAPGGETPQAEMKLFDQESKTIAGAALLIGVSSILSRVLGLFRDRLLVGRFGVGDELDAYYASFQVPNFLFALLVLGTLSV